METPTQNTEQEAPQETPETTPEPEATQPEEAQPAAEEEAQPAAEEAQPAEAAEAAQPDEAQPAAEETQPDEAAEATQPAAEAAQPDEAQPAEDAPPADQIVQQGKHRVRIEDLLKAGTHFGHLTSRWNPKMKSYIFMQRNGIHIIDLMQTQTLLDKASDAASRFAKQGKRILFVGTKKQAKDTVRQLAKDSGSPYVVERWLGGTLTNFQTIRKSIRRMEDLMKMEKDGTLDQLKKKERLMKGREREKLERNLGGIADMARMPGALFIVDINREHIAVAEARKLNIPIIAMVDSNCDPDLVDYLIPCNDDAHKSIQLITTTVASAVNEGKKQREIEQASRKAEKEKREEGKGSK